MSIDFVASDTGSTLIVNCFDDSTATPINLTGASVNLKYRVGGAALQTKTMTINTPATSGQVQYTFLTGELIAGTVTAEIEITDGTGKVLTSLPLTGWDTRAKL